MSLSLRSLGSLLVKSGTDRAGTGDFPVLSITMRDGLVDQSEKFKKRVASKDTSKYRVAYKNELVVGFPIDEGVLGFQTKYPAGIVSPAYDVWSLKHPEKTHIPYIERYLRSTQARHIYASKMQGAVARRRSLKKDDFLSIEIPFPPLEDQKLIAYLLGKVENLIAQRKKHQQELDDLLKSIFLEMFGDPVRNEKGWEKPELKQFGKISTGNTPPRKDAKNYSSQSIEWIKTDNITADSNVVSQAAEYLSDAGAKKARTVKKGALMIACIAGSVESIGRAALTDRTVAFNQQINAIQPQKDVNPFFLYTLFKISKSYIQSHASKGMKKILTKGDFEKITMIKPPIDLQEKFAIAGEKVESVKWLYKSSLEYLTSLYDSLSKIAFKGELDLSRVPLPESKRTIIDLAQISTASDRTLKASKRAIDQLNDFNGKHSAILKALQAPSALTGLDIPTLKAAREMAEQASLWRTPLDELKNMNSIARATEALAASSGVQKLTQEMASINESTKLAKQIADSLPKLDMGWLREQQAMIEAATQPFKEMQKSMAALALPDETVRALKESDHTMWSLQPVLPNTADWMPQFSAPAVSVGREDEDEPRYIFTRHDVLQALAEEPSLSVKGLVGKLTRLEVITQQGYERIKKLVFELLNEGEIEQHYNDEDNSIALKALA